MSVKILQERLEGYHCQSEQDEENALKEILQEVALSSLARTDFFKHAAFQGGTCLRILYSLDRFSEDLDFILQKTNPGFRWEPYFKNLDEEFQAYGVQITVRSASEVEESVQKMFLKDDSLRKILILKHQSRNRRPATLRIKFELDINPPAGGRSEIKYADFPFPFAVTVQDPPTLFAGKSHALLCREYTKGRDWYDFLWYVSRKIQPNYEFLAKACEQQGPWKGQALSVNRDWFLAEVETKIKTMDWNEAKNEVRRFLKPRESQTLELWNEHFFMDRVWKLATYL